jgi:rhodanese-related sulfurtransferase
VLKHEGIPYISSIIHSSSHAGYYPDALPMTVKIVFDPVDGRLLGSQIVGFDGVDKRIDMMAHILKHRETVYDLGEIEHAYAPPFSSAKDPVNVAGMVADNILNGMVKIIHWDELRNLDYSSTVLIDVRTPDEHKLGSIDRAVNIDVDTMRGRLDEIPKGQQIVVFCGTGHRSYFASRILVQSGFSEVYNLSGGYLTYEHATQKQSNEDIFSKDVIGKDDHIYQSDPEKSSTPSGKTFEADACGLQCPGPIMRLKMEMDRLANGDQLRISATDQGFAKDVPVGAK